MHALLIFFGLNLGVSDYAGMSFGNFQLIVNAVLLVIIFIFFTQLLSPG